MQFFGAFPHTVLHLYCCIDKKNTGAFPMNLIALILAYFILEVAIRKYFYEIDCNIILTFFVTCTNIMILAA